MRSRRFVTSVPSASIRRPSSACALSCRISWCARIRHTPSRTPTPVSTTEAISRFIVLPFSSPPGGAGPRSHETRARRGDSRAPGGAGSTGRKAAAPTSFRVDGSFRANRAEVIPIEPVTDSVGVSVVATLGSSPPIARSSAAAAVWGPSATEKVTPLSATCIVFAVSVPRSVSSVRKLCTGRSSSACSRPALARAAGVKVTVGVAKGKKTYDKRETIKRRQIDRETRAMVKERSR